jgi:hypothetical protein
VDKWAAVVALEVAVLPLAVAVEEEVVVASTLVSCAIRVGLFLFSSFLFDYTC